jgi:hypothetical protein
MEDGEARCQYVKVPRHRVQLGNTVFREKYRERALRPSHSVPHVLRARRHATAAPSTTLHCLQEERGTSSESRERPSTVRRCLLSLRRQRVRLARAAAAAAAAIRSNSRSRPLPSLQPH